MKKRLFTSILMLLAAMALPGMAWGDTKSTVLEVDYAAKATDTWQVTSGNTGSQQVTRGTATTIGGVSYNPFSVVKDGTTLLEEHGVYVSSGNFYLSCTGAQYIGLRCTNTNGASLAIKGLLAGDVIEIATNGGAANSLTPTVSTPSDAVNATISESTGVYKHDFTHDTSRSAYYYKYDITVSADGDVCFNVAQNCYIAYIKVVRSGSETPVTQYTVTAASEDESKGTVAITDASSDNKYDQGSSVTVTATAKSGYEFDYWSNGESTDSYSTENPLTIASLGADFALKAHFKKTAVAPTTSDYGTFDFKNFVIENDLENGTKPTWGATIDGADVQVLTYVSGSINQTFGNRFAAGPVNQNAEKNCFKFRNYAKEKSGTDQTYTGLYSQYADRTFSILGLNVGDRITFTFANANTTLTYGDNVSVVNNQTITVTEAGRMDFKAVAGVVITQVKIEAPLTQYTVTAESSNTDQGTVAITNASSDNKYDQGSSVTVTATANSGYEFDYWTNGESTDSYSTENPLTISNLGADFALKAHFKKTAVVPTEFSYGTFDFKQFVIDNSLLNGTKPAWGATIDGADAQVLTYVSGSVNETFDNRFAAGPVAQNATDNCFKFRKDNGDTYTGLYSQFADRTFSILGLNVGDRITFTFANANTTLTYGDNVSVVNNQTITVTEAGRMDFKAVAGVVITQVKIEAPLTQYTVTAESTNADQGTVAITDASSDNKYDQGSSVTVTATAKSGYEFDYWTNGESTDSYSTENPLTITSLGADFALKAHFKKGETVTPPTCEAATDGKVSTADGKVTIIAGRSDNSEATVTTYYKTSLFADVPEIDESWSTLPDNGVVTMEKSGYIFVYAKSSTGVLTGITTIDVELPVYGKYDFAGIATENVEDGNSNPQAITWSNGNLIVGENTIGLNRTFSGDKIALRRTTSDQGLYVQYDAGYLTISRLNVNDIVKVEYSAGSLDIKSGTADPLGNTTDGHSTASYVIKGGNDLSLNVSKAAWIYSVEISNDDAVSAPVISVSDSKEITINGGTSLQGKAVTIYYTTDGTNPTTNSTEYTGPFTPEKTVYIKAFSVIADNTDIQSPVAEQKVSIGTFTGEKNVFDFAALAGDFGEFAFAETAVSLNGYWNASTPNEDRDFYEITNTDHFTSVDNSVKVLMRAKTGNTLSYANGGMTGSNSGLIALTGLTEGQRIVVEYKEGGSVRYNTGVDKGEVTVGGNTLERGSTISSGAFVTVTSGDYIVLYNVANSTITKISVLDPAATYSVGLPSSSEHGTVEANVTSAGEGETVTLTVTPDDGYVVESVTVEDADNSTVAVTTVTANSTYTFVMPAQNVTVTVTFAKFVEASVGETRTWTFDDLSGTYTEIKEANGAYLRGFGTRTFTVTDGEEQTLTFADGEQVSVRKYLAVGNSMWPLEFTENTTAASTAKNSGSNLIGAGSFAVNTTVPGTIYAQLSTPTEQNARIYCTDNITKPQTFSLTADGIQEVSYTTTAENGGTFFIGAVSGKFNIHAVRFVPTSEASTYQLAVSAVDNGTITAKVGDTTIEEGGTAQVIPGSTVTLTAVPDNGYQLTGWQDENGNSLGAIGQSIVTTTSMPAGVLTVKAVFETQPASPKSITEATTFLFDSYPVGINLSGSTVYASADGLYISGHSNTAPAQIVSGSASGSMGSENVAPAQCLYINGSQNGDLSNQAVNAYTRDAVGLNIGTPGILYALISGATKDGEERYFNIYVNGVKNQTKITGTDAVVVSQVMTDDVSNVFVSVSGGYAKIYALRFENAQTVTVEESSETSEFVAIVSGSDATVAKVTTEGETNVSIAGTVNVGGTEVPVTDIAAGTFTAENTAHVSSIDLSETAVNWGTETEPAKRDEVPALENIDESTLIYLPSTANVTGTNVVVKSGSGSTATYTCSDFQVDNEKLEDGKSVVVPKKFTAAKAELKRTFTADKKCTVCLPYDFTAPTGGKFFVFNGISGGKVQMKEVTELKANVPYIFQPAGDSSITGENVEVSISDAPQTENGADFAFVGTYEEIIWTNPEGIYGFAAEDKDGSTVGSFARAGSNASIMACRAYLKYTGTEVISDVASTRGMTELPEILEIEWLASDGSKYTTDINKVLSDSDSEAPVYNLSGQRVDKNYKGLVIVNGKKVVRK